MRIASLILTFAILSSTTMAQIGTVEIDRPAYWYEPPWRSSLYVSVGYGRPIGWYGELGYHFDKWVSLAFLITTNDQYVSGYGGPSLGGLIRLHAPIEEWRVTPYLQFSAVGSSHPSTAVSTTAGAMVEVFPWLYLRPELGTSWIGLEQEPPEGSYTHWTKWKFWYTAGFALELTL